MIVMISWIVSGTVEVVIFGFNVKPRKKFVIEIMTVIKICVPSA